ncbi:MAG: hypothetical protein WC402_03455 [Candidatus Pacearchaeota archaeon]|jgi:hypothetical protein
MENKNIIWKDKLNYFTIWGLFIFSISVSFSAGFFVLGKITMMFTLFSLICGIFIFFIIRFLLERRLLIVLKEGIILDNTKLLHRATLFTRTNWKFVSKRNFINWKNISKLNIENHYVRQGRVAGLITFLIIKTDKEKYQTEVIDTSGFLEALKKSNKFSLLSKEALEFIKKIK